MSDGALPTGSTSWWWRRRSCADESSRTRRRRFPGGRQERLRAVEVELDQCWDLLRQRRAKEEFNQDPDDAEARSPGTVENYRQ
jgi:hypothetical protein